MRVHNLLEQPNLQSTLRQSLVSMSQQQCIIIFLQILEMKAHKIQIMDSLAYKIHIMDSLAYKGQAEEEKRLDIPIYTYMSQRKNNLKYTR